MIRLNEMNQMIDDLSEKIKTQVTFAQSQGGSHLRITADLEQLDYLVNALHQQVLVVEQAVHLEYRARPTNEMARMRELGWAIEDTGGGCKAYFKNVIGSRGMRWMVTKQWDPDVPTDRNEVIAVGLYNRESEMITIFHSTFNDLLDVRLDLNTV